ncbi:NADH-quinone oxidoreductase subunit N [Bowdeniella nasicola]|uniref:NADH-quinone oxidoreductase subunit N n=1 Tax=Bowdeniella nasicola TaxID=208480 RepID=A0A1Q5Q202_9ACTO|nr:NADH-quinone oxidoreductase subunit NuoN [Bowdeniella nasicola]OKL53871.1 NADH-quinone oxidoreductase subunit N [Bowdeniella nasicola]
MSQFAAPAIAWGALTPILIVFGAAVIGVLVEAFVPRGPRRTIQCVIALFAVAVALVAVVWRWTIAAHFGSTSVLNGSLQEDPFSLGAQGILLVVTLFALLMIADRTSLGDGAFAASGATRPGSVEEEDYTRAGFAQTEVFPLMLFSLGGMLVFPATADMVTLFIALEVLSLPLYILCGLARRRRLLSQEASLKYFLLGAFSSAFMLFGIALVYGFSGSFRFAEIAEAVVLVAGKDTLLLAGCVLILVGLLFKVGAAPFHTWTPDVYQGAPTPITGFMAASTKLAAFAALLRFWYTIAYQMQWDLNGPMLGAAVLTMLIGTVLGIVQNDIKRMLAYSSIAHVGFLLLGVVSLTQQALGGTLFYLLAYGLATVGAFGIVSLVREVDSDGNITSEATSLEQWAGLGKRHPLLAAAMVIFLLSFAGIPLTSGFIGKFVVFSAAVSGGLAWAVVIAVIASAATAFFYVRLIVLMYLTDAKDERTVAVDTEGPTSIAIALCAAATFVLGIVPGPALNMANHASLLLP